MTIPTYVTLATVKMDLRVTHDSDDALLVRYLAAAEDETKRFLDIDSLAVLYNESSTDASTSAEATLPASVETGILLLVRLRYDATTADEMNELRKAAETVLFPYRQRLGV